VPGAFISEQVNDMNTSCMKKIRYLSKGELQESNRRAIKAGCRSLKPEYIDGLPEAYRYPIFFELPWERHGWVRCQVGTGVPSQDYTPVFLDVPQIIYENLGVMDVSVDEE
jgi:hypothetical protein